MENNFDLNIDKYNNIINKAKKITKRKKNISIKSTIDDIFELQQQPIIKPVPFIMNNNTNKLKKELIEKDNIIDELKKQLLNKPNIIKKNDISEETNTIIEQLKNENKLLRDLFGDINEYFKTVLSTMPTPNAIDEFNKLFL